MNTVVIEMMRTTDRTVVRFLCSVEKSVSVKENAPGIGPCLLLRRKGIAARRKKRLFRKNIFLKKMKLFVDKQKKMW